MACCILILGLLSLLVWQLRKLGLLRPRSNAADWQPDGSLKLSGSRFSWHARSKSFGYAISGLVHVVRHEHNARIHLGAALLVIAMGAYFRISPQEFSLLILVIMAVCFAETVNTAFEHLCDVVSPEKNPSVKFAKDIAAGAVLICAVSAALVGAVIFWPYIHEALPHRLSHFDL